MEVCFKQKVEGLTQRELARKLGIGLEALAKIENDHKNLLTIVKKKIEVYLNEEW